MITFRREIRCHHVPSGVLFDRMSDRVQREPQVHTVAPSFDEIVVTRFTADADTMTLPRGF